MTYAATRTEEDARRQLDIYNKCLCEAGFAEEAARMYVCAPSENEGHGWGVAVPDSIKLSAGRKRDFWYACYRATTLMQIPIVCFECYLTGTGEPHSAETCTGDGMCETL